MSKKTSAKARREQPRAVRLYRSNGHAFETRIFARDIHETYCVQPGCRFNGQHAAQGVCHTRLKSPNVRYLEAKHKQARELVEEMREIAKGERMSQKRYIDYLERTLECDWMNHEFTMDELIRLRGKLALYEVESKR